MTAGEAWRTNNEALVESYEAANAMNEVYARIGELVAPVLSTIQSTAAELANTMLD